MMADLVSDNESRQYYEVYEISFVKCEIYDQSDVKMRSCVDS